MTPLVSCRELCMRLGDEDLLVLDLREGFVASRIPGALSMSLARLEVEEHILPDDELIVVCGVRADGSDAERAWRLLVVRHPRTVCLHGGMEGWIAGGFPLESTVGDAMDVLY